MSKEQRENIDRMMRDGPLDIGGDVEAQRDIFEQMLTARPIPSDVFTVAGNLGRIPVVEVAIRDLKADNVVMFFHGGGYALGSACAAVAMGAEIARRAIARVISVEYRLAPEHPFPAALEDALAAYRGLLDSGVPASQITLAGESAGAGLAVATLVAGKVYGLPQPACAVLFSPWIDLTLAGESMQTMADLDPALTEAGLRRRALEYAASVDPTDGLISPLFADLSGLPPLFIAAGSHEILLDDATRLAARAASNHVAVTLEITPEVSHVFQAFASVLDEADAALTRAAAFVRAHAHTGSPGADRGSDAEPSARTDEHNRLRGERS